MTPIDRSVPLALLLAVAAARAQHPAMVHRTDQGTPPATAATSLGADCFRVPIHTQTDDQRLGAYGWWTSGDDFKASFHDGFVFFPLLGPDAPENLPVRFRTTRIVVGGEPIADVAEARHVRSDWRYEYRYAGGVTEAYDVLPHGIEQTFVVQRRPQVAGDLIVEGRIETRLVAEPVGFGHQALSFRDGQDLVRVVYGAAFVCDAAGDTIAIDTAYDGDSVRLRVPAEWLRSASFPITVDPLTSAVTYQTGSGSAAVDPSIHREDETTTRNTMVAFARVFSSGDHDVYLRLGSADLTSGSNVFSDVSTNWSSLLPDVTFVGGADRWVLVFWRHTGAEDRVRAYFHDRDNTTFASGVLDTSLNPAGEHATFPAVGGTSHPTIGTEALLVYRMDPFFGNSARTQVHAAVLDAANRRIGGVGIVENQRDAENPDVNCQLGWGETGWIVVYQARDSAIDDYDVFARRVSLDPGLTISAERLVGPDGLGDKVRPVVQGWDGHYLVAMLQDVTPETNGQYFGRNVLTARVEWTAAAAPTIRPHHVSSSSASQDLTHVRLGFDGVTQSHWCVLHDAAVFTAPTTVATRVGHTGGTIETTALGPQRFHGAVSWNGVAREFQIVVCANDAPNQIYAHRMQHGPSVWNLVYGGSCGAGVITSDTLPYPGSERYRVLLQNAPPGQVAALVLSFGSGSTDLGPIGAPNCTNNLAAFAGTIPMVTDGAGGAAFTLALPDRPLFTGDLYWQYVYIWPAAPTPLPIGATQGMRASVR